MSQLQGNDLFYGPLYPVAVQLRTAWRQASSLFGLWLPSSQHSTLNIVGTQNAWGACQFSSVTQSCLTLCDPMNSSTPGLPCPPPTPGVYPNSCPLSRWCHPAISSSVVPFSCPQSFPACACVQKGLIYLFECFWSFCWVEPDALLTSTLSLSNSQLTHVLETLLLLHVRAQLCPSLCNSMDCCLPSSSVLGIF